MSETSSDPRNDLLLECRRIAEEALYTAQAHFQVAADSGLIAKLLLVGLSTTAAVLGILVSQGLPEWLGIVAAGASTVVGVAGYLDFGKLAFRHEVAAASFTAVRHSATALGRAFAGHLETSQLLTEVRILSNRYEALVLGSPPTTQKAISKARDRIQSGLFQNDPPD